MLSVESQCPLCQLKELTTTREELLTLRAEIKQKVEVSLDIISG